MISPSAPKTAPSSRSPAVPFAAPAGEGSLACKVLVTEIEFLALEAVWEELSERASNRSPGLAWSWVRAWWDMFGARCPKTGRTGRPYVLVLYDDVTPVAVYPFVSHEAPRWSPSLRRLRIMGHSGEIEPSGLTEEAFALVAIGYEERARAIAVRHLAERVAAGEWDCAMLRQMNHEEAPRAHPNGPAHAYSVTKVKPGPQIVRLPGKWAEFRRALSKSMRDNLGYYPRLLQRAGHAHMVRIHRGGQALEEAAGDLVRLHRARVFSEIGQKHQDYFADPWQPEMLRYGIERAAREGEGFIATLEIDGQVAAAQSFLQRDNELLVHYSGFDPRFAKFSPLLILQAEVFRRAMEEDGVRKLNLLFGASPWQKRWGSEREGQEIRTLIIRKRVGTAIRAAIYTIARESVAFSRRSGLRRWRDQWSFRGASRGA